MLAQGFKILVALFLLSEDIWVFILVGRWPSLGSARSSLRGGTPPGWAPPRWSVLSPPALPHGTLCS